MTIFAGALRAVRSLGLGRGQKKEQVRAVDDFELVAEFDLVVPPESVHDTSLADLRRDFGDRIFFDHQMTDGNYKQPSTRLESGRRFRAKIFRIKKPVFSHRCLKKLNDEKAVLVGAQGLALVYRVAEDKLPTKFWLVSFDKPEALFFDSFDGCHRVPCLGPPDQTSLLRQFHSGFFELFEHDRGWDDRFGILCLIPLD